MDCHIILSFFLSSSYTSTVPEEEKGGPDLFYEQRERFIYQQVLEKDPNSV
jgi:hypothetical protein